MSDPRPPEQIPLPQDTRGDGNNPYNNRNHESVAIDREDVMAVAALMGTVAGSLNEIDKMNAGGQNSYIKAKKIDPKQALTNFIKHNPKAHTTSQPQQPQPQQPQPQPPIQQPTQTIQTQITQNNTSDLEQRVKELEKIVNSYKKITKFKRGISYSINTNKISGEYKDPGDILDIVANSLANQTKTITLKLNDSNKNR